MARLVGLPANVRLDRKTLKGTLSRVKSFVTLTPPVNIISFFFSVANAPGKNIY